MQNLRKLAESLLPISLAPNEAKLFAFLLHINDKYKLGLTFRVAGGWTRDKMLGKESDDIDIALDKMTGAEFGKYVAKETGKQGNIIQSNPEQSKHLETMTTTIFGQDVDFVNLRSESYGDSRIPTMELGTPEQDALRRDLTINALFYNVNKGKVEDFTGKGIEDLKNKVLRTPLEPDKTFLDDPLRILRLLRFYSRYDGSQIDPAAIEAMKNPQVQEALKNKVSPERIAVELKKLLAGSQPDNAMRVLHQTGLFQNVFDVPETKGFNDWTMDQNSPYHVDNVLEHTLKVMKQLQQLAHENGMSDDKRALLLFAALFHDVGKLDPKIKGVKETEKGLHSTYHGHEDVSAQVVKAIMEKLKMSNEEIDYVTNVVQEHMKPHQGNDYWTDKNIRKYLNQFADKWSDIILHSIADVRSKGTASGEEDAQKRYELMNRFKTMPPPPPKPVVNGTEVMNMFPDLNPGSGFIGEVNKKLMDAQFQNPNLTKEDATQMIQSWGPDLRARYTGISKTKKQPQQKPPQPPVQAGWYGQIKEAEAKQLCGRVLKKVVGLYEVNPTLVLETPQTLYSIRMSGETVGTNGEGTLDKLIGKTICALGLVSDGLFVISQWSELANSENADTVRMKRETPAEMTQFHEGDRVRKRKRGLAFDQIEGVVDHIEKGLMFVKWNGIKDQEVFRLSDTVAIYAVLEKI